MQSSLKKIAYASIFITINIFLWFYFDIGSLLSLESMQQHRELLEQYVQNNYLLAVALYLLVYILDAALFLPATAVLIMVGGFLFGIVPAVCYAVVAATCGATCAFLTTRYLFGSAMQARYGNKLADFNALIEKNYIRYLLFIRLVPVFPFFLTNVLAGLTLIPVLTFIWTTALGIIPNVIIYACIGQQLTTLTKFSDIFTTNFFLAIALLCALSLLPLVINRNK